MVIKNRKSLNDLSVQGLSVINELHQFFRAIVSLLEVMQKHASDLSSEGLVGLSVRSLAGEGFGNEREKVFADDGGAFIFGHLFEGLEGQLGGFEIRLGDIYLIGLDISGLVVLMLGGARGILLVLPARMTTSSRASVLESSAALLIVVLGGSLLPAAMMSRASIHVRIYTVRILISRISVSLSSSARLMQHLRVPDKRLRGQGLRLRRAGLIVNWRRSAG